MDDYWRITKKNWIVKPIDYDRIPLKPSRNVEYNATVAQLVEQTIRNRQVMGSNPIGGSNRIW